MKSSAWLLVGLLVLACVAGPVGEKGERGEQGVQGAQGPTGPQGPPGVGPVGTLVMSAKANDPNLTAAGFAIVGSGRPEGFAQRPSSPVPGSHVTGAAVLGTKVYMVGGHNGSGASCLNFNTEFDLVAGTWSPRQPLNTGGGGRYAHTVVGHNGRVYVFGGYCTAGITSVDVYNPVDNAWSPLAPIPGNNHYGAAGGVLKDGKMHLVAGYDHVTVNGVSAVHHVYDFSTNSWSTSAPLPAPRYHVASGVLPDGRLIVAGGENSGCRSETWIYDPTGDSWTPVRSMPTALYLHQGAVLGGRFHTFMGHNCSGQNNYHYVYDPATDTWTGSASIPYTAYWPVVAQLPGSALIMSGWNGPNVVNVYEYLAPLFLYGKQ